MVDMSRPQSVVPKLEWPIPPFFRAKWSELSLEEALRFIELVNHHPDISKNVWR